MTWHPFSNLDPGQIERLALLAEECAEVIQIVGKILRHGFESCHPDDPHETSNRKLLEKEIGHVHVAVGFLVGNDDVDEKEFTRHSKEKMGRIYNYLHERQGGLT